MLNPPTRHPAVWLALAIAIVALVAATATLTAAFARPASGAGMVVGSAGFGMVPGGGGPGLYGAGMMGGTYGPAGYGAGMMGGAIAPQPQPGDPGFVPGTAALPRVIPVTAGPGYAFSPSTISVARGETVTFLVTTIGPAVHEFMVGSAEAVAADRAGTPEVADIGMMQTRSLTYTFDGPGPYAFACHAPGHYEAGMRGTIALVG
jgi:plastocyanin